MKRIFTSIDIGATTIKLVVAEVFKDQINVLASLSTPSRGIKKGLIIDANLALESLKELFSEVNNKLGVKINKVIAIVPEYYAEYSMVEGYTTITNEEHIVTSDDITRAFQACIYNKVPKDHELVGVQPIMFGLDEKKNLLKPIALVGYKLFLQGMMITVPSKNIYSVVSILDSIGVKVLDVMVGSLADYYAFMNKDTQGKLGAVINIGSSKTEVGIINKDILSASEVFAIGAKYIDKDLAYMYKLNKPDAKILKENFALASKRFASANEYYEINNIYGNELKINQYEVSEIVMARIIEILDLAQKQINLLTKKEISYIIITGGISEIPYFDEVAREILGNKVVIRGPLIMGIRHNSYSNCLGAIKYYEEKMRLRGKDTSMFTIDNEEELIAVKKKMVNLPNDSIIGKLFGNLFND